MKVIWSFLLLCQFVFSCAAQETFLPELPAQEKSVVEFSKPVRSICFFGVKEETKQYKEHDKGQKIVNNYFGPVYEHFPIFNISGGNAVTYHNTSGKYVFYRPNAKSRTGMVISNGEEEPIIVYDATKYLSEIKAYLKLKSADDIVPKSKALHDQFSYQGRMEQLLKANFKPDEKYAQQLIANAHTVHYTKAGNGQNRNCFCKQTATQIYADSALEQKGSYSYIYQYNDRQQLTKMEMFIDGKSYSITEYAISKLGLIENMSSPADDQQLVTKFIYEPDRYHIVTTEKEIPVSYETFFLNTEKQCYRRISHRADKSLVWDIKYFYDDFGRLLREEQDNNEMVYTYKSDKAAAFSSFSSYQLQPRKLLMSNEVHEDNNRHTFTSRNGEGQLNFRSITLTEKDCSTKTYSYDGNNKLTSVTVTTCKNSRHD